MHFYLFYLTGVCSALRSNVTPQSRLDLKLWSCHTLRKELLGSATIDLLDTLRTHHGKSKAPRTHSPSLTSNPLSFKHPHSLLSFTTYFLHHGYSMFLLSLDICTSVKQEMALLTPRDVLQRQNKKSLYDYKNHFKCLISYFHNKVLF